MKKSLNEQVSRIKDMMKKLNESQFNEYFSKPAPGESKYERFMDNYDVELRNAVRKLRKIKVSDIEIDEKITKRLEQELVNYDENVLGMIEYWIDGYVDEDEIAKFAIRNMNRFGTEPQMVIYAIDDFTAILGIYDEEEEDDIPEDPSDGIGYSEDDLERDMIRHNETGEFHPDSPMRSK